MQTYNYTRLWFYIMKTTSCSVATIFKDFIPRGGHLDDVIQFYWSQPCLRQVAEAIPNSISFAIWDIVDAN